MAHVSVDPPAETDCFMLIYTKPSPYAGIFQDLFIYIYLFTCIARPPTCRAEYFEGNSQINVNCWLDSTKKKKINAEIIP